MKRSGRRKQGSQSNTASWRRRGRHWTTRLAGVALAAFGFTKLCAADATTPIDYTQRNGSFAPGNDTRASSEKQKPAVNSSVQEKRVTPGTVEKKTAPQADQRAGFQVKETRDKQVQPKDSHRPEAREHQASAYDHQRAAIATSSDTTKPPTVAKYQDSLTAASATNMARFPAIGRATNAKINRFVFRKNPPDPTLATDGKSVTPAAGGAVIGK